MGRRTGRQCLYHLDEYNEYMGGTFKLVPCIVIGMLIYRLKQSFA